MLSSDELRTYFFSLPTLYIWGGIISDSATRFRCFCNQISAIPQPKSDTLLQPKKGASATKKRRFRNQKQTIPQPKKDDSETKKGRFRNQNPRDSETKIRVSLQPRSVLLHSAWHRLQLRRVGGNKTVLKAAFLLLAHVQPHSTWHRL